MDISYSHAGSNRSQTYHHGKLINATLLRSIVRQYNIDYF